MPAPFKLIAASLTAVVSFVTVVAAQQPRIANGTVTPQPAGSPFAQSFRSLVAAQPDVAWIGYSVPVVNGERVMCCFMSGSTWVNGDVMMGDRSSCCGACRLEPSSQSTIVSPRQDAPAGPVKLEGSDRMVVLYRVAERRVERIRIFSEDCQLDAGGRQVHWLENVRPADSVALLETFATADAIDRRDRVGENAVSAIAMHGDPAADAALDRLVAPAQPESIRKKTTFWLGNARGRHGLDTLKRVLRDDPSEEVRKSAVFGVSQSREADAFSTLASLARTDKSDRIRSEAVFWIAQQGDARADSVILEALDKDPALEVRKKAVFALGQLKNDRGVPALVQVARGNDSPAVRGEAIFWLGQKAGSKASAAITERIEQDPDTEVKKKAVFALSQLPKDEGVPLLIRVARTNTNPAVRKQAMFWLGQSKDPRAIDFFAEVLAK
jgi:HEAT repeat protein